MGHATIVWFRSDLRTADNPALLAAVERGGPVVPVFIGCPDEEGDWRPGGAKRVYLHHALAALADKLESIGSRLILRAGESSLDTLRQLVKQTGADAVYWNRRYEPLVIERDKRIKRALRDDGVTVESFNGSLLFEPHEISTNEGNAYKVFSPFWRACSKLPPPPSPRAAPGAGQVPRPERWPHSLDLDDLRLMPGHPWGEKVANNWKIGETAALGQLSAFCKQKIFTYKEDRNRPDLDGTTMLSPALACGTISPWQCYHIAAGRTADAPDKAGRKGAEHFLSELGWREFSYHLLYHFPRTPDANLREQFDKFPWIDMRRGRHWLEAWRSGRTGYPIVDAGMRQLWQTGWMHNRVRMIVASLLTKQLRIHWLEGARWFWDTLVDADLANNTQGWQWSAGCGADAQPYFRIFNPMLQGEKFDPAGAYVRHWCPELAAVPEKYLHKPWQWSGAAGLDYPEPIVDHAEARDDALAAFERIKGK